MSDIVCLQEVDNYESVYEPHFKKYGYECELNYRYNVDAVLIGFKTDKFELVSKRQVDFNDVCEAYNWDCSFKKYNQALICLLKHKETGQKLVVVNTHFHWNPDFDYVKYA